MSVLEIGIGLKLISAMMALTWAVWIVFSDRRSVLYLCWATFSFCMAAVTLADVFANQLGTWRAVLLVFGGGTCSVSWLFTCAMFRANPDIGKFELLLVAGIIMPSVIKPFIVIAGSAFSIDTNIMGSVIDGLWRGQALLSSTALMLTIWEAARNWPEASNHGERRLRLIYIGTFGTMVFINMVMLKVFSLAQWPGLVELIQGISFTSIFALCSWALWYRHQYPLADTKALPEATQDDLLLGKRLNPLLDRERSYLNPDLSLPLLAKALGEPPNRVSRAITAGLKAANVNQLVNARRIDHAQTLLSDPAWEKATILQIALESGFNSIGPFNRALKARTGTTPRSFRQNLISGANPVPAE
jgi:AraC-like DNA-binding protein